MKLRIDSAVRSLEEAVGFSRSDVESHNRTAPNRIRSALQRKRQAAQSVAGALANIGIPFKRRDSPPTYAVPTVRRPSPVQRPVVGTGKYEPEPVLPDAEYEFILKILSSMSLVIERNPSVLTSLDEEAIRTLFLILLNGHYEGTATGETFNAAGKTDILIREKDRNVFIGECKFWHGPKAFDEAIDQLMGYLSWRDAKCALLVFNKTKDSTTVRNKMHETVQARAEFRKTISDTPGGDSRYVLVKASDPGREIVLTTQLYDFPSD